MVKKKPKIFTFSKRPVFSVCKQGTDTFVYTFVTKLVRKKQVLNLKSVRR